MTTPATATCPAPADLERLLAGRLPEAEQAEMAAHLDACPRCQAALDRLSGDIWVAPARLPASDGPAYWSALARLRADGVMSPPNTPTGPLTERHEDDDEPASLDFLQPSDEPGSLGRLDHFEVRQRIGQGGMGVVLKAFDTCLQRHVAIKVLNPRLAKDDAAHQRFCREARAAARVTHENVVATHYVEETAEGVPYLVMQYIPGGSLQDWLDAHGPPPVGDILRVARQIAEGLAAAHAEGLVHRDIKPANILVEARGSDPSGRGTDSGVRTPGSSLRVRLTDFGLARATEDVRITQTGFVAGTPLYMAPEQARGEPVDARTDLFSFGSVLYALCTGRAPFEGSTPFVVLQAVTEGKARPVRELNPAVPAWLAAVIEKLHAKAPADRFQSAAEVAEVFAAQLAYIERDLPLPVCEKTKARAARRRWVLPGVAAAAFLAGGLATGLGWPRPAVRPAVAADEGPAPRQTLDGKTGPVWAVAYSPDGATLAAALDDGTVKLWDVAAGRAVATLNEHTGPVWSVAFSGDGSHLVTGSDDGSVVVWDAAKRAKLRSLPANGSVRCVAVSADGSTVAAGTRDGGVRVWDLPSGTERAAKAKAHRGVVMAVALSADGKQLVTGGGDKVLRVWDAVTGSELWTLEGHRGGVYAAALAPDGKTVASGGWDHTVRLWSADTGAAGPVLEGHKQDVWAVAFGPGGSLVASAGEDRTVRVWDAAGKPLASFPGGGGTLYAVAVSPDGKAVAAGGRDGVVRLWNAPAGR